MMSEYERIRNTNHNNLISVNIIKDRHINNDLQSITTGLVKATSVKHKDIWLKQELVEGVDMAVVTGTRLNGNTEQWIDSTEINQDGFKTQDSFGKDGGKGEGIAQRHL